MNKRDDVSKLYEKSNFISNILRYLFWINISLVVVSILSSDSLKQATIIGQIIIAICYLSLSVWDDCCLWYNAEATRRKNLIEDAYNIDITNLQTEGYYNNSVSNPNLKYILNSFESVYFSKNIAESMNCTKYTSALISLLVFVLAIKELNDRQNVMLAIQIVFSSHLLLGFIQFCVYKMRLNTIYNEFYQNLVTIGVNSQKQINFLLSTVMEYEAVKAYYKVRLSTKKYNELNSELSSSWEKICKKVKITDEKIEHKEDDK